METMSEALERLDDAGFGDDPAGNFLYIAAGLLRLFTVALTA